MYIHTYTYIYIHIKGIATAATAAVKLQGAPKLRKKKLYWKALDASQVCL
jgi:hypothetical protein